MEELKLDSQRLSPESLTKNILGLEEEFKSLEENLKILTQNCHYYKKSILERKGARKTTKLEHHKLASSLHKKVEFFKYKLSLKSRILALKTLRSIISKIDKSKASEKKVDQDIENEQK